MSFPLTRLIYLTLRSPIDILLKTPANRSSRFFHDTANLYNQIQNHVLRYSKANYQFKTANQEQATALVSNIITEGIIFGTIYYQYKKSKHRHQSELEELRSQIYSLSYHQKLLKEKLDREPITPLPILEEYQPSG